MLLTFNENGQLGSRLLAGKVDATVEVKIDRRQRTRRHRPDTEDQVKTKVIPLELKTGKMFSKLGEHVCILNTYLLQHVQRNKQKGYQRNLVLGT